MKHRLLPVEIFETGVDPQGNTAEQWYGCTDSPYYVQPGDIIVQVHVIPMPPDFAEGTYRLQLGLYASKTGIRVPIQIDGQAVTDRILLQSIDVGR